jgi:hypothetical protein
VCALRLIKPSSSSAAAATTLAQSERLLIACQSFSAQKFKTRSRRSLGNKTLVMEILELDIRAAREEHLVKLGFRPLAKQSCQELIHIN